MTAAPPAGFRPVADIDTVDLSRHALVEASAGTGKTYTIENLVIRLLKESPDLNLENILLVTFTEKVTSELKLRIRQKIEQTLDGDPDLNDAVRKKLAEAPDGFDNAAITTIHGFCHTLLKEFPFETGNLFQQEVIDDGPLLEKLLRVQMRSDWPDRYGPHLETLLALSGFSANANGFLETAVSLAQRLSDNSARQILIPDPEELNVDDLLEEARETVLALKALVGGPPRFSDGYARLNINVRTRTATLRDMVEPIEQVLNQVDAKTCRLPDFMAVVATLGRRHASGERNIDRLIPGKWLKAGENLQECPNLSAIKDQLDELVGLFVRFSHVLMLAAVRQLRKDADDLKMRNGWISYQDMLNRVAGFLTGKDAGDGIHKIRQRYRVAFVDEFQDTDEVQWQIFSTLFLQNQDDDQPANRLFLIGDPKQAIYAFRGADVFTYLEARQQMKTLAGEGLANLYDLTMNWRSVPDLVDAFNRIFSHGAWFGDREHKGPFEIGYSPSGSPEADQLPATIRCDRSQRPPLNVMDLAAAPSHSAAKAMLAGFICREIRYLVEDGGIRIADTRGHDRALHFGDIAILVRSQSEFALIEPLLKELSIPYAFYRKPGLFQCTEAHWLSMVLRAACHPEQAAIVRLALLTPFFDIAPAVLVSRRELPVDHTSQHLLAHWHALAQKRRWGPLFQSLTEDSGLTLRHCVDPGWERTETNFQQLFDFLESSAYTRNLDAGGMVTLLDSLRIATIGARSDDDIHQIEDEGNKVQILTMHVSKGLEFPVVFIAGGLTVRNDSGMHVYHTADPINPGGGFRKVIDLTASTGRVAAEKENEDENKRLYYVAFTRSRFKLYIPYYPDSSNHSWRGPICRFVSHSIDQAIRIAGNPSVPGSGWHVVSNSVPQMPGTASDRNENGAATIHRVAGDLLPTHTDFRHRKIFLESFSSIGHRMIRSADGLGRQTAFRLVDVARREDDEPVSAIPDPALAMPGSSEALPGGTHMGSMFHHIFENIDFQRIVDGPEDILAEDGTRTIIESALVLYRIEPRWTPQIARIVAITLRKPIYTEDTALVLGRIEPGLRRHEMEFYFPLAAPPPERIRVPGCSISGGPYRETVIRGFIDLVFFWKGKYYTADWKSNRLTDGYGQAAMTREMAAAGYELQYRLYTIATLRWLKRRLGDRFDLDRHFGGVFYLFIRGMGEGGQEGIFHVAPESLLPLMALEESIIEQLSVLPW